MMASILEQFLKQGKHILLKISNVKFNPAPSQIVTNSNMEAKDKQ